MMIQLPYSVGERQSSISWSCRCTLSERTSCQLASECLAIILYL